MLALASFVISLAGLDTASPYGGLGASRASWIGSMAEPALILVFFTVGAVSASDNPYLMNHAIAGSPYALVLPTHLLGLVAFFMIVLVENGRIPIENPGVTTEISMIEEGRVLEYSGREYALVKWGSWMKFFLLSSVFMNVFVSPGAWAPPPTCRALCSPSRFCSASSRCAAWPSWWWTPRSPSCGSSGSPSSSARRSCSRCSASRPPT